jgi:hypothetical protein
MMQHLITNPEVNRKLLHLLYILIPLILQRLDPDWGRVGLTIFVLVYIPFDFALRRFVFVRPLAEMVFRKHELKPDRWLTGGVWLKR